MKLNLKDKKNDNNFKNNNNSNNHRQQNINKHKNKKKRGKKRPITTDIFLPIVKKTKHTYYATKKQKQQCNKRKFA